MNMRPVHLEKDYPILSRFWESRGLPSVPAEYLPSLGLVVEHGDALVAGAFLAFCDADLATIGFIAANPLVPSQMRSEALDNLIMSLCEIAKSHGVEVVSAATNVGALQRRYEELGFKKTDENVTHYARRLT